jgi:hypothetical protein
MTDLDICQPAAALAVPDPSDTDSWIAVVQDIIKIANVIYDTPFVPEGLRGSAPAVAAAMLAGREMGLGIMTSLANIDVIHGRPTQKALLMRAMIQSKGHRWQDGDVSDTRAVVRGCRKGESEWAEVVFTADQARRAGIDLGKYPADKLYARATSRLARRKFADVIMGMPYSSEEIEDGGGDEGTVTETPAITAPAPAQRTAQRRQKPAQAAGRPTGSPGAPTAQGNDSPAPTASRAGPDRPTGAPSAGASAPTTAPAPAMSAPAGSDLPPLPGEDEEPAEPEFDKDEPGTVTRAQNMIGKIQTIYSSEMAFKRTERDQMIAATEEIIGRELTGPAAGKTHNNLSWREAQVLIDTLERCCQLPGEPRDNLMALLVQPREAREMREAADE